MARYLQPEVEETMENPAAGETAQLVLVVESGTKQAVGEHVERFSGEVMSELSKDVLIVRLPEEELREFVQIPAIGSVSYDGGMQVLGAKTA